MEYVSIRELDNKHCFNNDLNFEINYITQNIQYSITYTFVNDLEPCGTLKYYDYEYYHSWHITEKLNMEANYYDIYTSLTRIYDKISFLLARFPET